MTFEEDLDARAAWEAANSAQAEADAQAEYESSLHENCLGKFKVKEVIEKKLKVADELRGRSDEREAVRMEGALEALSDLLNELGLRLKDEVKK